MNCIFGLWHEDGVAAVPGVESILGREVREYRSNQHWFQLWPGGVSVQATDAGIPLYSRQTYWEDDTGALSWQDVIDGVYDSVIDSAIRKIVNSGRWSSQYPYMLVNGAEMDVDTPQQPLYPGNTSDVFKPMYEYVSQRVSNLGARVNQGGPVALSWAPRAEQWLRDPSDPTSAYAYAPAPTSYDYVGCHAYLKWKGSRKQPTWQDRSLPQVVGNLHDFAALANRHCIILEAGIAAPQTSQGTDAERAAYVTEFFDAMAQWTAGPGQIRLISWTNRYEAGGGDYKIETMGPLTLAAFKAAVNRPFYSALTY